MPYRIDLHGAGEAALDRLVELGALDVEPYRDGIAALVPDSVEPRDVADAVGITDFIVSAAADRDEGSVWTLSPPRVRVGSHTLTLGDTSVFGTGLHPTTALCLEILADCVASDRPGGMLDVGTGSGVLAIAALKLGVPRVTAIDIDARAVQVAAENARANGIGGRLDVVPGGPDAISGAWPLVAANILAAPLIEMAPLLVRRVGRHGRLLLSGIPEAVEANVLDAYRHLGMRHVESRRRDGWVAPVLWASW